MTIQIELQRSAQPSQAYAIGNVRDVINSHANRVIALPALSYGLGAFAKDTDPANAGEGIILRGKTYITPPTENAGNPLPLNNLGDVTTPFCAGLIGEPIALGMFSTEMQLSQVYKGVMQKISSMTNPQISSLIFLELIGLLPISEIYDRALKKSVHTGDVLITSSKYASQYFKKRIIYNDLIARNYSPEHLLPLVIVGVCLKANCQTLSLNQFEQAVFYQPPLLDVSQEQVGFSEVKTHSHAIGWRKQSSFQELLTRACKGGPWQEIYSNINEKILPILLETPPDYVVHLDEWSRLSGGLVRIFAVDSALISFRDH